VGGLVDSTMSGQSPPFTLCSKINCGSGVVLLLTPVRPALDREMAPSPEDRFTFLTQQRSVSLHARRNPLDVWNVLAAQPHRVVVAQSLLFLGVGITPMPAMSRYRLRPE